MHNWWMRVPLMRKMRNLFLVIMLLFVTVVLFSVLRSEGQLRQVDSVMDRNGEIGEFIGRFQEERIKLSTVIYPSGVFDIEGYQVLREQTETVLSLYQQSLREENATKTMQSLAHALQLSMEGYRTAEQQLLTLSARGEQGEEKFIRLYYEMVQRAEYINRYASSLLLSTIQYGDSVYIAVKAQRRATYLFYVGGVLLCAAMLLMVQRQMRSSIIEPVLRMNTAAQQLTAGQMQTPDVPVESRDELGELSITFNVMKNELSSRFDALIEKAEIEKQLRESAVEREQMQNLLERTRFAQLQSQMNPHFLFNSLNTVSALAAIEQAPVTREMIGEIATFFRYSLETDEDIVPLEKELAIVQDYMNIQHGRYGDRVGLEVDCPPALRQIAVPKFILQPLVENSVIHGLTKTDQGGLIRVRVFRNRVGQIEVRVVDNGRGMTSDEQQSPKSVGLRNIQARLHLLDKNSTMVLRSRPGMGTLVCLRFTASDGREGEE